MKQILSNNLGLNFSYLKNIHILHPRYHPKIIGLILKNRQKNKRVFANEITQLVIMKMKMKMTKDHIDTTQIDLGLKSVLLYVLSNT